MVEINGATNVMQSCPLCGGLSLRVFFERRNVPVHQNMVCATAKEARRFTRGDLVLTFCRTCEFVFNAAFDPDNLRYSAAYDNTQSCSPYYKHYVIDLAESLLMKYRLANKDLVEVGCGKGEFLRLLCKDGRNRGVGFDPSYVGPDTAEQGTAHFVRAFYGPEQTQNVPDFVCCRHVIEHVQSPLEMLRGVRQAMGNRRNSFAYFETPALPWILETGTFWDFFYEHCSYFTAESLTWAFQQTGFEVLEAYSAFDAQYLCLEAKPALAHSTDGAAASRCAPGLWSKIQSFLAGLKERTAACEAKVDELNRAGGCAIWGAAAKGTTLVNTIDPENRHILFLIDINPAKQGKFVPGTGHRIVSPRYLKEQNRTIGGILNMNPNYLEENRSILAQLGIEVPILSL